MIHLQGAFPRPHLLHIEGVSWTAPAEKPRWKPETGNLFQMPGVGLGAARGVRNENLSIAQVTDFGGQLSEKRNDLTLSFPGMSGCCP